MKSYSVLYSPWHKHHSGLLHHTWMSKMPHERFRLPETGRGGRVGCYNFPPCDKFMYTSYHTISYHILSYIYIIQTTCISKPSKSIGNWMNPSPTPNNPRVYTLGFNRTLSRSITSRRSQPSGSIQTLRKPHGELGIGHSGKLIPIGSMGLVYLPTWMNGWFLWFSCR